ncbi:sensor histidine kinase [uncultured Jatrophihabitans sp.]|uniref:sensor histidine kinase n=1 Tax=uncultured Jatrophihabitans sp. TaxID=1610747 RepID=UPI0035CC527B
MTTTAQRPAAADEPSAAHTPGGQDIARMWSGGWQRYVFPSVWLVYLGQTVSGVHQHVAGAAAVVGYVIVGLFAACYIVALPVTRAHRIRTFWYLYALTIVLTFAELFFAHSDAFVFLVYVAVLTIAARQRWSWGAVITYALVATFLPPAIPSWHQSVDWNDGATTLLVGFAMFGFFHVIESNRELAAARAEVARLAAENERSRIARDLHDLLGHSLTTITVKAGLARKLGERGETARAYTEITEVEELSRRTLGDVRAAVSGHREVTLAGELATAREVLRAAAITAEMPASVDIVASRLSELFGWVVREGVTNIVRHSRAEQCSINFGHNWIELTDTGHGAGPGACKGSGIAGLRDRVSAYGGTLTAASKLNGFCLRAEVPIDVADAAPAAQPESVRA